MKLALVTGAASGIGRALAGRLAASGARVVLADVDGEAAEEAAAKLPQAEGVELDVRDAAAFAALVEALRARHTRLDMLINCAGVGLAGELRDTRLSDWKRLLDVNLWGVIHGVAAAYPAMLEQGSGTLVNVASGAGLLPRPGMTAYATSKHAVVGLGLSLREEAAAFGVRVCTVCPGHVATPIAARSTYRGLDGAQLQAAIPFAGLAPERCARRILRGVAKNRAIVTVDALTSLEWWLYRVWPRLGGWVGRWRLGRMRAFRTEPKLVAMTEDA